MLFITLNEISTSLCMVMI